MKPTTLDWHFPLPRCHTGIPLGNGTQGLLIWGGGDGALCVTIARAGFWKHAAREGSAAHAATAGFGTSATFAEVRRLFELRDEAALSRLFVRGEEHPFQIGGGRLEIRFAQGFKPVLGRMHLPDGRVGITLENESGGQRTLWIGQAFGEEIAWIEGLETSERVALRPAWDFLGETLARHGIAPPLSWADEAGGCFAQTLPDDPALAVAWRCSGSRLIIATALGKADEHGVLTEPPHQLFHRLAAQLGHAFLHHEKLSADARAWWAAYWASVPEVELPDAALQHAWLLGLVKKAGLTTPGGVAATLQGPWMEDDHIPPWSNDYHFNINVQLIYGSALPTNRAAHFGPLWGLMRGWLPALRQMGEAFFQRPGAMMLPHAVDDRCHVVGHFWTGTIDHACCAWMAQTAWLHYRYTLDETILREVAWPLLNGAFEGYWAMLERVPAGDGWRFSLPLTVSPEYNGSGLNAVGRDASFQLAALHRVAAILPRAAAVLGLPADDRWREVAAKLPPYTLVEFPHAFRPDLHPPQTRIALWEGQDLAESHRHHAHLAAVWPFETVDPHSPGHWAVVGRTLRHWGVMGAGKWTGWCLPWAAILCARCGLADAAVAWLHWYLQVFTNAGHGTLHDPDFGGAGGSWSDGALDQPGFQRPAGFHELMQMDAAMALLSAVVELLVQSRDDERGGTITVLPRLPKHWRDFRFGGIRTQGAFLVGAEVARGRVRQITVRSERGGPLRLRHPIAAARLERDGQPHNQPVLQTAPDGLGTGLLELEMRPGETLTLRAR